MAKEGVKRTLISGEEVDALGVQSLVLIKGEL